MNGGGTTPRRPAPREERSLYVKICGMCTAADATIALRAGADFVGVVVYGPGPRAQGLAGAAAVLASVPPAARVGVFVDLPTEHVLPAAKRLQLAVIQLHGAEDPEAVALLQAAGQAYVWKAVRPRDGADFEALALRYRDVVDALVVDGGSAALPGGSGQRFDWQAVASRRAALGGVPLVVAGGLDPDNVAEAVRVLSPAVVDVSSGVEEMVGRKSIDMVRAFVAAARAAAEGRTPERGP